jgi:beta-galactosidase
VSTYNPNRLNQKRNKESTLDLLVEGMGRVNFGEHMRDLKGITEKVELVKGSVAQELFGWEVFNLPLDRQQLAGLKSEKGRTNQPAFYRGRFELREVGDTFWDMRKWGKGIVWVNGRNLGRFWAVGPQQTLYCPGPWLKRGVNEIVILALNGTATHKVSGLTEPILDEIDPQAVDWTHRKPNQSLNLEDVSGIHNGSFAPASASLTVHFHARRGRYFCLEALNSYPGDGYSTCAELDLLGEDGSPLARDQWSIAYADSEEVVGEDGSASNVLDSRPDSFWHTQWEPPPAKHPHQVVIDLGQEETISGMRYLPRQDGVSNGCIREFRVYVATEIFPGL